MYIANRIIFTEHFAELAFHEAYFGTVALLTTLRISQNINHPETMELFRSASINNYYLSQVHLQHGSLPIGSA